MKKLFKNDDGATAIEYALIAALIAVVIVVALTFTGQGVKDDFDSVAKQVGDAMNATEPAGGSPSTPATPPVASGPRPQ